MVTKLNHSVVSITLNIANWAWSSSRCKKFYDVLRSFTMALTFDHVKNLLKSNSVYKLRNTESVICDRLKKTPRVNQTKLYKSLTVIKTAKREILVERDFPNAIENTVTLR